MYGIHVTIAIIDNLNPDEVKHIFHLHINYQENTPYRVLQLT